MKVKASDKFMFPLSMDFGPFQSADSQVAAQSQMYDLHAILIHKGSSASQGHYGKATYCPVLSRCEKHNMFCTAGFVAYLRTQTLSLTDSIASTATKTMYITHAQLCSITCCKPSQTRLLLSITGYVRTRNMFFCITVAHVLEESTGKWWRFDDETVTTMPDGPVGERADHGVSTAPGTSTKKVQAEAMKASSAQFCCLRQACATWTTALSTRPQ